LLDVQHLKGLVWR